VESDDDGERGSGDDGKGEIGKIELRKFDLVLTRREREREPGGGCISMYGRRGAEEEGTGQLRKGASFPSYEMTERLVKCSR